MTPTFPTDEQGLIHAAKISDFVVRHIDGDACSLTQLDGWALRRQGSRIDLDSAQTPWGEAHWPLLRFQYQVVALPQG